jgi:hypothetical protein
MHIRDIRILLHIMYPSPLRLQSAAEILKASTASKLSVARERAALEAMAATAVEVQRRETELAVAKFNAEASHGSRVEEVVAAARAKAEAEAAAGQSSKLYPSPPKPFKLANRYPL